MAMSRTTSFGFQAPSQNLKKHYSKIQLYNSKKKHRQRDEQTLFNMTLPASVGSQRKRKELKRFPSQNIVRKCQHLTTF